MAKVGPFLAQRDKTGKNGLVWIGVPERCDKCKDEYPMSWITFNGKQFLCVACEADEHYDPESHFDPNSIEYSSSYVADEPKEEQSTFDFLEECDCCHDEFPIREMTMGKDGNTLLCRKCASGEIDVTVGDEGPYDKYFRD